MRVIVNAYNTTGAGTATVTRWMLTSLCQKIRDADIYFILPDDFALEEFKEKVGLKIIRLPAFSGMMKYAFRFLYDFFLLPLFSVVLNASAVIVLANYSPMPVKGRKIVFMRHFFLVDPGQEVHMDAATAFLEGLRRLVFRWTLKTTEILVVQSEVIRRALLRRYGKGKSKILVLPNPKSNLLDFTCRVNAAKRRKDGVILYVSRYYPHKQHGFLLDMAEKHQAELRRRHIKFYITVDTTETNRSARRFLDILKKRGLSDIVRNIGEVPHETLSSYYAAAACLFFPSACETFGNPLVEAMAFGLPIVAPDLPYVHAVCGSAALCYKFGDTGDAFEKLTALVDDPTLHAAQSLKSRTQFKKFPTTDQWVDTVFSLAG